MSRSSGFASSLAVTVRGSSAMPQIGQFPGSARTISGCIGHVYSVLLAASAGDSGSSAIPHLDTAPAQSAAPPDTSDKHRPACLSPHRPAEQQHGPSRTESRPHSPRSCRTRRRTQRHQSRSHRHRPRRSRQNLLRIGLELRQASRRAKEIFFAVVQRFVESGLGIYIHAANRVFLPDGKRCGVWCVQRSKCSISGSRIALAESCRY